MPLSVLRGFVDTLTGDGGSPLAEAVAPRWGADPASVRYVRASANAVHTADAPGRPLVLRLTPAATRTRAAVAAEQAFAELLAARGVPVARPVPTTDGALVVAAGSWHATAWERIDGAHRELDTLTADDVACWGETLGRLHAASAGWPGAGRPRWSEPGPSGDPAVDRVVAAALADVRERLRAAPGGGPAEVGVHGDYELDNVLWRAGPAAGPLAVVDLDDCGVSWAGADVAFALRDVVGDEVATAAAAVGGGPGSWHPTVRAFVGGYRRARPLPGSEVALLPVFLRLHHAASLVRLVRAVDVPDSPGLPPWLARLRAALVATIGRYRAQLATPG